MFFTRSHCDYLFFSQRHQQKSRNTFMHTHHRPQKIIDKSSTKTVWTLRKNQSTKWAPFYPNTRLLRFGIYRFWVPSWLPFSSKGKVIDIAERFLLSIRSIFSIISLTKKPIDVRKCLCSLPLDSFREVARGWESSWMSCGRYDYNFFSISSSMTAAMLTTAKTKKKVSIEWGR